MDHPFPKLRPEYSYLLSVMTVRPECVRRVDEVATKILTVRSQFEAVRKATAVPVIFSGPSFYREADLNFNLSPAQGDPWRKVSTHVPKPIGPYPSWQAAAIDAYTREGLNRIGEGKWTWELICYYAELFNGFGYRDFHHEHSPYLWGGTNIQAVGKYDADGQFDGKDMDVQLGVIPIAKRLVQLAPDLAPSIIPADIPKPISTEIAKTDNPKHDVTWLQTGLKSLGFDLDIDGNYGRETKTVVAAFQQAYQLVKDASGYAGKETCEAVDRALAMMKEAS